MTKNNNKPDKNSQSGFWKKLFRRNKSVESVKAPVKEKTPVLKENTDSGVKVVNHSSKLNFSSEKAKKKAAPKRKKKSSINYYLILLLIISVLLILHGSYLYVLTTGWLGINCLIVYFRLKIYLAKKRKSDKAWKKILFEGFVPPVFYASLVCWLIYLIHLLRGGV